MRGIRAGRCGSHGRRRFIPAHAGNTLQPCPATDKLSVHPRACGEYATQQIRLRIHAGSSPRMRGIQHNRFLAIVINAVHPRACGEYRPMIAFSRSWIGSSPRMRGIRQVDGTHAVDQRFIPAHAGNTSGVGGQHYQAPVHPRACGEYLISSCSNQ